MKNVRIWSFCGLYFPALRLNTEICKSLSLCIESKSGKIPFFVQCKAPLLHKLTRSMRYLTKSFFLTMIWLRESKICNVDVLYTYYILKATYNSKTFSQTVCSSVNSQWVSVNICMHSRCGKYGPEKLRLGKHFMQCKASLFHEVL